jgi:hypothetical protein
MIANESFKPIFPKNLKSNLVTRKIMNTILFDILHQVHCQSNETNPKFCFDNSFWNDSKVNENYERNFEKVPKF